MTNAGQEDNHRKARIETAGLHLLRAVPKASPHDRALPVIESLKGRRFESATAVYILDDAGHLIGIVTIPKLLSAPPGAQMSDIMRDHPPVASIHDDQERVAALAVHHGIAAVPVVDSQRRFIGVVPPVALIRILRQEHVEDLHRLAGIMESSSHLFTSLDSPPLRRARDRLPWLLVGLAGSILATMVMAYFEATLQARIAVAFFVPAIVYLADAIGTQTETIIVRGLSLGELSFWRVLISELKTGLLIGITLGFIALGAVLLLFGDLRLAVAVSLAVLSAGTVATCIGMLFPWLLFKMGKDPALGSGPVATIIQDVLSLLIYFVIATLLIL